MKSYPQKQTLLLDKNYQMVKMISWQTAITKVVIGKAKVIQQYSHVIWRSKQNPQLYIRKPRIIFEHGLVKSKVMKKGYIKRISNEALLQRDEHKCQYCGKELTLKTMTRDHVYPKVYGGRAKDDNVVCACYECNQKKAGRTPDEAGMPLLKPLKKLEMFFVSDRMRKIYESYFNEGLATV